MYPAVLHRDFFLRRPQKFPFVQIYPGDLATAAGKSRTGRANEDVQVGAADAVSSGAAGARE